MDDFKIVGFNYILRSIISPNSLSPPIYYLSKPLVPLINYVPQSIISHGSLCPQIHYLTRSIIFPNPLSSQIRYISQSVKSPNPFSPQIQYLPNTLDSLIDYFLPSVSFQSIVLSNTSGPPIHNLPQSNISPNLLSAPNLPIPNLSLYLLPHHNPLLPHFFHRNTLSPKISNFT